MSADLSTREGLFAVMRRHAAEREAAKPIVAELLAREELPWDEAIPEEWKTAGFVEELTKGASVNAEQNPTRTLRVLELALAVLTCTSEQYPRVVADRLTGAIWKEIGWIETYHDAYVAADRAYRVAEHTFSLQASLSHDLACAQLSHAGVLVLTERFEEATQKTEETAEIFAEFNDALRLAMTWATRAMLNRYRGNFEQAIRLYERVLSDLNESDETHRHTIATTYNNLSDIYLAIGQAAEAVGAAKRASDLYARLGIPRDKPTWQMARALLANGDFERSFELLQTLRAGFLGRRMPDSAGLVALDMVECLIALDRLEEAQALTEMVIGELRVAGLNDRALVALAYLRDLLPAKKPSHAVRYVRSYLEKLRTQPHLVFLPLADGDL